MSVTLAIVVTGAMSIEGLVLAGRDHPPAVPPAAAGPPAAPSATPSHPARGHRRPAVTVTPQPGQGAHLVDTESAQPQPTPQARPTPRVQPSTPAPVPTVTVTRSVPPSTQPSPPASPVPSKVCVVNLFGITVCLGGD